MAITLDGTNGITTTGLTASGTATVGSLVSTAPIPVTEGGTGRATGTTAYGLIAAGTTATGAQQTLAAGATTQVLVGGGASALPVWTTATGSGAPVRSASPTLTGTIALNSFSGITTDSANPNINLYNTNSSQTRITMSSDVYGTNTGIIVGMFGGNGPGISAGGLMSLRCGTTTANANNGIFINTTGAVTMSAYGAGAAQFDSGGNITSVSDERIKRNIRPFATGLKEILGIQSSGGVILHGYTKESKLDQSRDNYAGFSAQIVKRYIPEAVDKNPDQAAIPAIPATDTSPAVDAVPFIEGMLTLNPFVIVAALVNAVAELSEQNKLLEARISKLEIK